MSKNRFITITNEIKYFYEYAELKAKYASFPMDHL